MYKKEMLDYFANSIETERVRLGYTQTEFAKQLGISISTYKNIINRQTNSFNIVLVPKLFELTGKYLYELLGIENQETRILKQFRRLTDRQKAYIESKIDFETEFSCLHPQETECYLNVLRLTGNMQDGMILDSAYEEHLYCPNFIRKQEDILHCGLRITSNHLHPVYVQGDVLGISKRPPRDGDTCILIHRETRRCYIRKFCQGEPCSFVPINDYGEPIFVNKSDKNDLLQWIKFGIVIAVFR